MAGERAWPGFGVCGFAIALGLLAAGCGTRSDSDLFSPQQVVSGQGSAGQGGGSSGGATGAGGTLSVAGSAGSGGQASGGAASGGAAGSAGQASGGTSGSSGEGGGSGSSGSAGSANIDCEPVGGEALTETGHCYVLHEDLYTWAEARAHCAGEGGYLATIGSLTENDFLWSLLADRKWIGATDGREPTQPGAGEYAWVTGEPMNYSNWTPGQPSAAAQQCPPQPGGPQPQFCYEHCMYQWDPEGDENAGEWNDQGCWESEAFICEHE